jgi:shikimate dehydrogenase
MALAGVLGFPVAHSRSPAMMNAAFAELGLDDWRYLKLPVQPERFADLVRALPGSGYRGANVTIPHKPAAHALADDLSPAAESIGAVNTLMFEGGGIHGDNTDAGGLLDAIGESPAGRRALVLGAGGAGRAAAWALQTASAEVVLWNRTSARAEGLARELGVGLMSGSAPVDILVNATSVGLRGEDPHAELPLVEAGLVVDLVYGSEPTALCRWAAGCGARVVDGLEVLVRQGARSLELWTGRPAPLDTMRRAATSVH